jgi:hypothetical protein
MGVGEHHPFSTPLGLPPDVRDGFLMRLDGDRWTVLAEGLTMPTSSASIPPAIMSTSARPSPSRSPASRSGATDLSEPRKGGYAPARRLHRRSGLRLCRRSLGSGDRQQCAGEDRQRGHRACVSRADSAMGRSSGVGAGCRPHGPRAFRSTPAVFMRNISSIAFAGPQMTTILLGSLLGSAILTVAAPVAGARTAGWGYSPDHAPFIEIEADLQHRTKGDLTSED